MGVVKEARLSQRISAPRTAQETPAVPEIRVCGIDEAGRGPLAGPVTAAAVILPAVFPREILGDSKALSARRRREAAAIIREKAIAWGIGWASHEEIDAINIHRATLLAMARAVEALAVTPDRLLVDGLFCPSCGIPGSAIVRGDATVPEIMAASILAKTARDAWMVAYSLEEPGYGFDRHKGYPTVEHRRILMALGPSRIHRRSFKVTSPSA
jgi:ribonuclease HII